MIDSYLILNRKSKGIIKIFIIIILFLIILFLGIINTLNINHYFKTHSEVQKIHSYFYLKVLIPQKEINSITNKTLLLDNNKYNFNIHQIEDNIIFKDEDNYRIVYLEIYNLDNTYKINGYQLTATFVDNSKKIINILKE